MPNAKNKNTTKPNKSEKTQQIPGKQKAHIREKTNKSKEIKNIKEKPTKHKEKHRIEQINNKSAY